MIIIKNQIINYLNVLEIYTKNISILNDSKSSLTEALINFRQNKSVCTFLELNGTCPKSNSKRNIKSIIKYDFV